ncbi:MAG: hypothetical protein C5B54_09165 [Acidobacteria bacterium]|nr:MAG: hypothetical protein C5B54_09165 [Acidobacteriota bacterium]
MPPHVRQAHATLRQVLGPTRQRGSLDRLHQLPVKALQQAHAAYTTLATAGQTATARLSARATARAVASALADKARSVTPVQPLGGPYRSRITPTTKNVAHRARMMQYLQGFSSRLHSARERAYVEERYRQMINGEVRPHGLSKRFGLTKSRAIQFEGLTYKIFQRARSVIGV